MYWPRGSIEIMPLCTDVKSSKSYAYVEPFRMRTNTKSIPATPNVSIFHRNQKASRLFVLLLARTLDLCRTAESLLSVLALFA